MVQKILFTMLLSQFCLFGIAQEKLFREAVSRGSSASGVYCINNSKKANYTLGQMRSFVKQAGYLPTIGTTQIRSHFGSPYEVVKTLEFIHPNDFDRYIFCHLNGSGNVSYSQLKSKGCCFIPFVATNLFYKPENTILSGCVKIGDGKYMRDTWVLRYDNVLWSGTVVDGLLDGSGVGLYVNDKGKYEYFIGTFQHGLATTAIDIRRVTRNDSEEKRYSNYSEGKSVEFDRFLCDKALNNQNPQLLQALSWYYRPLYSEEADRLEQIYRKMRGITVNNCSDFKVDDFVHSFWMTYKQFDFDTRSMVRKAQEMLDIYQIIPALKLGISGPYFGVSALSSLAHLETRLAWYGDWVDKDRATLKNGLDIARKNEKSSQCGFNDFFTQARIKLESKYDTFEKKVNADRAEYRKFMEPKWEKDREQYEDERSNPKIDWDSSKEPSGGMTSVGGLFSSYKKHYHDGTLYIRMGSIEQVKWNIIYDGDGKVSCYRIEWASEGIRSKLTSQRDFRTRGEMMGAIVNALK